MGMPPRIYGCITELELSKSNSELTKKINLHNEKIIAELPLKDEWPPISRKMFAFTDDSDHIPYEPNYAYGGRLIHFGGNFKSIEHEWKEWKIKFEDLLSKLIWSNAEVHFITEYTDVQTFSWNINYNKWNFDSNNIIIKPIEREYWEYRGDASWDD